jgi:hypothetical protein
MSVIPFKRPVPKDETEPHGSGEAFCIACSHTWQAVAPVGTVDLECPSCHCHKGKWKFEFYPSESQLVRVCDCGNQLFYLTPDGHLCANCGIYQGY